MKNRTLHETPSIALHKLKILTPSLAHVFKTHTHTHTHTHTNIHIKQNPTLLTLGNNKSQNRLFIPHIHIYIHAHSHIFLHLPTTPRGFFLLALPYNSYFLQILWRSHVFHSPCLHTRGQQFTWCLRKLLSREATLLRPNYNPTPLQLVQ